MSQAGIASNAQSLSAVDKIQVDTFTPPGTNPVVPDAANTITVTGGQVAAGSTTNVIRTDSLAANTFTIEVQRSQAVGVSTIGDNGVCHFDSAAFDVDANGFVQLNGGGVAVANITVDASTPPGTNPVVPNGSGNMVLTGAQVAAGTTTNVIRTDSLAANSCTVQIQRSQAVGVSTIGDNGVSHFDSARFSVDANGFVSTNGAGIGETITGQSGGALSPTAGNWNISGASTAAGTSPVVTSGAVSTLTVNVQKSQAIASTDATKVGLCNFDSADFTVDGNGFVSATTTGFLKTLTGNSGGAIAPTANNINTVGTGSITIAGSGSTLTTQLTGLTNHNVLVGAGTATITNVPPTSNAGVPLVSQGAGTDPAFGTATVVGGGTGSTAFNINGPIYSSTTTTGSLQAATLTSGQLLIGGTTTPAAANLSAGTGISIANGNNSITISATGTGLSWSDKSTNFNAAVNNGYFIAGSCVATLPAAPSNGDTIAFFVDGAFVVTITANTGQTIQISSNVSSSAGTQANTSTGDACTLVYRSTDTKWCAKSFVGAWNKT